jgi:hypothetical protein
MMGLLCQIFRSFTLLRLTMGFQDFIVFLKTHTHVTGHMVPTVPLGMEKIVQKIWI